MLNSSEELDEEWRRRCRADEILLRFDPPPKEPDLAAAIWTRATTNDPPDAVLGGLASGYAASLWDAPGEVVQAQIGCLFEAAVQIAGARPERLARAHSIVSAAAARVAIEAWRRRALTDALTGLPNRLAMDDDAGYWGRDGDLTVAYIDLDGLKAVNDSTGHDAGNRYICSFADALSAKMVGIGRAYRRGGDEFVLVSDASLTAVQSVLEALLADDNVADFSFGLASRPSDGDEISTLERAADRRMFEHKVAKKSQHAVGP